jgi:hypothetical protein
MPRCADLSCGRWRPERLAPKWAAGLRFNGEWYCSRECVEHAARVGLDAPAVPAASAGSLPPLKVGVLLRHLGAVTEFQLDAALDAQRASGRRLGAELLHQGVVSADVLLKALAAQANVSYLPSFDVNRVMQGPSWLPAETVRALGLVPFEADEKQKKLRVLCAAPVSKSATRALVKLTGWTAEPYLVDDEVWENALALYRPLTARETEQSLEVLTVTGTDDAAARVADSALLDRSVTMRHASFGRHTWIRVEGPRQVSDLLIPAMEEPCLAERIAR